MQLKTLQFQLRILQLIKKILEKVKKKKINLKQTPNLIRANYLQANLTNLNKIQIAFYQRKPQKMTKLKRIHYDQKNQDPDLKIIIIKTSKIKRNLTPNQGQNKILEVNQKIKNLIKTKSVPSKLNLNLINYNSTPTHPIKSKTSTNLRRTKIRTRKKIRIKIKMSISTSTKTKTKTKTRIRIKIRIRIKTRKISIETKTDPKIGLRNAKRERTKTEKTKNIKVNMIKKTGNILTQEVTGNLKVIQGERRVVVALLTEIFLKRRKIPNRRCINKFRSKLISCSIKMRERMTKTLKLEISRYRIY